MNGHATPHSRRHRALLVTLLAAATTGSVALASGAPGSVTLGSGAQVGPDEEEVPAWWMLAPAAPLFPTGVGTHGLPEGWSVVGGPAGYEFETGEDGGRILRGRGGGPRNAFLVDPTIRGDFLLELDVRLARGEGNSGIQIRSTVDEPGDRMFGYQIEVDPSERSWSGGLYDEGRRGWIASLADNLDAREAFVPGAWNRYTILAVGPRIRTWVNDVPAVDHVDFLDAEGRIGLQVHSGRCDVAWRNLRIADLGRRSPIVLLDPDGSDDSAIRVEPADGLVASEDGWRLDPAGVTITSDRPWPDGPAGLRVEAFLERGSLRLVLGDPKLGPGYVTTIPGPLGTADRPSVIRAWRWEDRMMVLVDDVPLVPGPRVLPGPLAITIETGRGTVGAIRTIEIEPPTSVETAARTEARRLAREAETTGDDA